MDKLEQIAASLAVPIIDLTDSEYSQDFSFMLARVENLALRLNQNGRSTEKMLNDIKLGMFGEMCIARALKRAGHEVIHNDEETTLEYHWDLKVDSLKTEIKFQKSQSEYLQFSNERAASFAVEKWKSWDIMISWSLVSDIVIPELVISNLAFDPSLELYVPSKFSGMYLKTGKAITKGLAVKVET